MEVQETERIARLEVEVSTLKEHRVETNNILRSIDDKLDSVVTNGATTATEVKELKGQVEHNRKRADLVPTIFVTAVITALVSSFIGTGGGSKAQASEGKTQVVATQTEGN